MDHKNDSLTIYIMELHVLPCCHGYIPANSKVDELTYNA